MRSSEGYAGGQWGYWGYIGVEGDFEGFGVLSSWGYMSQVMLFA